MIEDTTRRAVAGVGDLEAEISRHSTNKPKVAATSTATAMLPVSLLVATYVPLPHSSPVPTLRTTHIHLRFHAAPAAVVPAPVAPARLMPRLSSVEFIAVEVMISGPA